VTDVLGMTPPPPVDPPPGPRTVKIATPLYMRVSFGVVAVLVATSMFIFSLGVIVQQQHLQSRLDVANFRADSETARANQNDALTRLEQECRSARNSDYLITTGKIAAQIARLFSVAGSNPGNREILQPIFDSLGQLYDQQANAELNLKNAIEECRQPR